MEGKKEGVTGGIGVNEVWTMKGSWELARFRVSITEIIISLVSILLGSQHSLKRTVIGSCCYQSLLAIYFYLRRCLELETKQGTIKSYSN